MTRIVSKISLYDILAMIVPGSIVLMGLGMFDKICDKVQDLYIIEYFGVEGHAFWTVTGTIFFLTLSYAIGIVIQMINVWVIKGIYTRKNRCYVSTYIREKINEDRPELEELMRGAKQIVDATQRTDAAMRAYYKAYNTAIIYHGHTAVLDLEKQIAMLRNFSIAILPFSIALFAPKCCCGFILWVLLYVLLYIVTCQRMRKEVDFVFEEYEAVKQLGLDKKNN